MIRDPNWMKEYLEREKDSSMFNIIQRLEKHKHAKRERRKEIEHLLSINEIDYRHHDYSTGKNFSVTLGKAPFIGLGSHYDVVRGTPGANDNASANVVVIDILRKYQKNPLKNIGIRGFFFDEEEVELRGSRAYVREKGIADLAGMYNLEMVGNGDRLAFWAEGSIQNGLLYNSVQESAKYRGVPTYTIPNIRKYMMNSGDHESFIEAGMKEAFCISAITKNDVQFAEKVGLISKTRSKLERLSQFFSSLDVDPHDAFSQSDLFRHYHRESDTSKHLNEETLKMVSDVVWRSLQNIDRSYEK